DLFYQTTETYHALKAIAREHQIPVKDHVVLDPLNGYFKDRPYFAHLERYFDTIPAPAYGGKAPIQIAEATHPRAEVEGRSEEHTSELQSRFDLVCRLLLEKKK